MLELSKSQNVISIQTAGVKGGRSKPVKAFTESGIYMLMTVLKGNLAYQKIYRRAKRKLLVIDDYIGTKTLQHLLHSKPVVKLTIISDNKAHPPLRNVEYTDFQNENPGRNIAFITTAKKIHDRYIVLDYNTKDMRVYHCGASSKDAGKRITTITQIKDLTGYKDMVEDLLVNPPLVLK